jgi:signal transduction histidine kinase
MRHEVATIMLLASLLDAAPDVGPDSRQRARQLLGEARWLEELQRAYEDTLAGHADLTRSVPESIRLDLIAREVVAATRLSTQTTIDLYADEAWAYTDRLAFWRTLRNMIGNAVRAAGPRGRVGVGVASATDWAIIQVDDDGPGFGSVEPGMESLGLEIVREFADRWSGNLEIRRGPLGGCRVGLRMRAASAGRAYPAWGEFDAIADL